MRFTLAHARCSGDVESITPTPEDLDPNFMTLWVRLRCPGCGASTRVGVPAPEMFADLPALLVAVGSSVEEYRDALERGDNETVDRIDQKLRESPEVLKLALHAMRPGASGRVEKLAHDDATREVGG